MLLYDAIKHVVVVVVVVVVGSSSSSVATAATIVIRIVVVVIRIVVVIISKAHVWLFLNENHVGMTIGTTGSMIHGIRSHRYRYE